jgi:Holliday junction resolvase RusA-like endonuclease
MVVTTMMAMVITDLLRRITGWLSDKTAPTLLSCLSEPKPAARPRVTGKGWSYYPKTYAIHQKDMAAALAAQQLGPKSERHFVLLVDCVCTKPKTGKLSYPRGDTDNYLKSIMDAITKDGRTWGDDRQVVTTIANRRYATEGEDPGYYVTLFELPDNA